jgi:two-component system, chemotaxis family, sensor kinase CheA
LASERPVEQIRAKCNIPTIAASVKVTPLRIAATAVTDSAASFAQKDKAEVTTVIAADVTDFAAFDVSDNISGNDAPSPVDPAASIASGPDNVLRVDAERIDSVLNLVGELILAKSMLQQALLEFGERFPKDVLRGKFSDAMAFQGRVLNDLQHSVMKIRMVPVDQLFRRFPRIVRDVGRQSGKDVELTVRGGQTDLDKSILDAIAEPLTHILRNAVGHGIETAEERIRAGKRPQGTLRLAAYHQGNQVVIEVSDDGRGVDPEKVRQRAVSQRLLNAEQATRLTEAETLDLILKPGFSTAEEITELSGRGVGLDVVQSVLGRLKGTVQIETVLGRGTTFRLRLPLTLAIIRALLFRVEQRLYALPLNAVAEIARAFEEEIHQVEHYDVLQLRNDVLPLLRLGAAPPIAPETARRKVFVLVINSGERKFGVVVDALEGEDELVIKALDDQSITTDLVSGASILGDGRVVLILNMIALMDRFTQGRTGGGRPEAGRGKAGGSEASGPRMAGLLSTLPAARNTDNGVQPGGRQPRGTAGGQA